MNDGKTPVDQVVAKFGNRYSLAYALTKEGGAYFDAALISKWRSRGGRIPQRWHRLIRRAGRRRGIPIEAADLIDWSEHGEKTRKESRTRTGGQGGENSQADGS